MATTSSKHARVTRRTFPIRTSRRQCPLRRLIRDQASRGRQSLHQAYLQGVRDYNDALKDGRIAGPDAEDVVDAIARYSVTKDRDLIRTVISAALQTLGLVKSNVVVADIVDMSFAKAAVAELGPSQGRSG